jgi:hypothetical protein
MSRRKYSYGVKPNLITIHPPEPCGRDKELAKRLAEEEKARREMARKDSEFKAKLREEAKVGMGTKKSQPAIVKIGL